MKTRAIVYGKKNCGLCENRKESLRKFVALAKKKGVTVEIDIDYRDVKTVDGLAAFCGEDRSNAEIPVVILEDEKSKTMKVWGGPREAITQNDLLQVFGLVGED